MQFYRKTKVTFIVHIVINYYLDGI